MTNGWAWGRNAFGQLGDLTSTSRKTPIGIAAYVQLNTNLTFIRDLVFISVSGGTSHSLGVDSLGNGWSWSSVGPESGLGSGGGGLNLTPHPVIMPGGSVTTPQPVGGLKFLAVAAGDLFSMALDTAGTVYVCGDNTKGQLGNGTSGAGTGISTLISVTMPGGVTFKAIAAGEDFCLALDTTGTAWGWGNNINGQLGTSGGTHIVPTAMVMPGGVAFASITAGVKFGAALDTTGKAWAWGDNASGQLGIGTTSNSPAHTSPTAVTMPSGITFNSIASGAAHTLALDTGGNVWGWGNNNNGQLGYGTILPALSPASANMPTGITFSTIASGGSHALALDTLGHLWTWGYNFDGELGQGTSGSSADVHVPTAVIMPGGVTLKGIEGGDFHSLAFGTGGWSIGSLHLRG